jgi:nucleoside-diphosphate-sugar epimerase
MSSGLVFITGATGFIRAATALSALKAGYRVRLSVRKESQIQKLKSVFSEYAQALEFAVIPDITTSEAFAGKLDGVDYIFHLASPTPQGTDGAKMFPGAVKGTTSILKAAAKVPSVERVVVTSSIAALVPLEGIPEGGVIKGTTPNRETSVQPNFNTFFFKLEDNNWDLPVDESADWTGNNDLDAAFKLYCASKIQSNKAIWTFMESENPHFSLVAVYPTFVYGHNILQTELPELEGTTNGLLFGNIMTGNVWGFKNCIHVKDVADAMLRCLAPDVKDNSRFVISGAEPSWEETIAILQKHYPNAGWRLKADSPPLGRWPLDATKAEKELGMKWRSYEEMVREVMDQQLGIMSRGSNV